MQLRTESCLRKGPLLSRCGSTMIETCILSLIKHLASTVDNDSIPLPLDQASITPSELILQPQHMKVRRG